MMNPRPPVTASQFRSGFTLIELLTVIAIVGILSSLLFVTFGGVTDGARRAKTRVQFTQWASAMEAFRQEYGFYPDFRTNPADTLPFEDGVVNSASESQKFIEALSGRTLDSERFGENLIDGDLGWDAGNQKSIRFCSFGQDDLNEGDELVDAFENAQIVVLVDRNQDGAIRIGMGLDYEDWPPIKINGTSTDPGFDTDVVRAGVIFYSPGAGNATSDIIKSW